MKIRALILTVLLFAASAATAVLATDSLLGEKFPNTGIGRVSADASRESSRGSGGSCPERPAEFFVAPSKVSSQPGFSLPGEAGSFCPNVNPLNSETNCYECAKAPIPRWEAKQRSQVKDSVRASAQAEKELGKFTYAPCGASQIEEALLEAGNGAKAIVSAVTPGCGGHWFNAQNVDGVVSFMCGQKGIDASIAFELFDFFHYIIR